MRKIALDFLSRPVEIGDKVAAPYSKKTLVKGTVTKITEKGCKALLEVPYQCYDRNQQKYVTIVEKEEKILRDLNFVKLEIPTQGVNELWET